MNDLLPQFYSLCRNSWSQVKVTGILVQLSVLIFVLLECFFLCKHLKAKVFKEVILKILHDGRVFICYWVWLFFFFKSNGLLCCILFLWEIIVFSVKQSKQSTLWHESICIYLALQTSRGHLGSKILIVLLDYLIIGHFY